MGTFRPQRSGAPGQSNQGGDAPAPGLSDLPRLPEETLRPTLRPQPRASEDPAFWQAAQAGSKPEAVAGVPLMPWDSPPSSASAPFDQSGYIPEQSDGGLDALLTAPRPRVNAGPLPGAAASEPSSRPSTLTTELRAAQARAVRPPDVARQAISELGVLAGQLATLSGEMESSGLARIHSGAYFDALRRYLALARQAWLSVAAERLEQDGASPDYRQRAISIARDVTRLRRECELAASNSQFPLPRRTPWRWSRRSRLATQALQTWQASLSAPPDPERMGAALFDLRGALNTALSGGLALTLLDTLSGASRWLVGAAAVAVGLSLAGAALAGQVERTAGYAVITLMTLCGWLALLLLLSRSLGALPELLAGASFSETHSSLNGREGSPVVAAALRVWWVIAGSAGVLLTVVGLVAGVLLVIRAPMAHTALDLLQHGWAAALPVSGWLSLAGGLLGTLLVPATLAAALSVVALALPVLLVSAQRFVGELAGSRRWSPGARRYALGPAMGSIAWLGGALTGLVWLLSARIGLDAMPLARFAVAGAPVMITARAIALAVAFATPWLLLIEAPFRSGVGRWRRAWLHDLRMRKNATESHVRRLSAPDPHTGAQDTSEETLRAMQYDLVLLQFYTARIEEAERASSSPLTRASALALLLFVVLAAALLDAGSSALLHALQVAVGL
ncbi:MAG TPA: hypothetical protein VF808_19485 [Ktedonobacterales bacterium]